MAFNKEFIDGCLIINTHTMSSDVKVNESPNHFIVLDAISRGINNVEKITRATKLRKDEVESIVNDLLTQRLVVKNEKKGFFFGKKRIEIGITEIGIKLLNSKKQELQQKLQQMQQSFDNGDGTQLQGYMNANRMWLPMMLFSGIMDMMFFTSMMSFMGLGMNPMESAMIGSGHDANSNTGDNNVHSANDQSGTSGDDSGSGGADYNDGNSDNFDSGGFDGFDGGGGFDSF
jgi:hypothetical protein